MLSRDEAIRLLDWAHGLNPGPWKSHSLHAARAAEGIAREVGLDAERAWVFGALHDIGRYEGVRGIHHILAGYNLLMEKGDADAARICMTHSFPGGDPMGYIGKWDVTEEERAFIVEYVGNAVMDDYDRLLQLCDALASAEGIGLIEKRLVDVAIRHGGITDAVTRKWAATLEIRRDFEERMGCSVYFLFKDSILNTFGYELPPESRTNV